MLNKVLPFLVSDIQEAVKEILKPYGAPSQFLSFIQAIEPAQRNRTDKYKKFKLKMSDSDIMDYITDTQEVERAPYKVKMKELNLLLTMNGFSELGDLFDNSLFSVSPYRNDKKLDYNKKGVIYNDIYRIRNGIL